MIRRCAAACLALLCAMSVVATPAMTRRVVAAAPSPLSTEQFKGVTGLRQVGPEFPLFDSRTPSGSQAIFLVETDARSAMNALVERARQIGFLKADGFSNGFCNSAPYGPNNRAAGPGEIRVGCSGEYAKADGTRLTIQIWVCESCPDPNSTASVAIVKDSGMRGVAPIPGLEPISATFELSPDARRSVLTPGDATLDQGRFPSVKGAQLAVTVSDDSTLCAITWFALLRVRRDPRHAFDVYASNLFDSSEGAKTIKVSGHLQVTQQSDRHGLQRLTLVQGGTLRQPWLLASRCEPTLD
jgi:hypothetical protein